MYERVRVRTAVYQLQGMDVYIGCEQHLKVKGTFFRHRCVWFCSLPFCLAANLLSDSLLYAYFLTVECVLLGHKESKSTDSLGFGSWPSHLSLIVSSRFIVSSHYILAKHFFTPRTRALYITMHRKSFNEHFAVSLSPTQKCCNNNSGSLSDLITATKRSSTQLTQLAIEAYPRPQTSLF